MKNFISMVAFLALGFLNNTFGQAAGNKDLPYKAEYSSDFSIGKPAYVNMILDMWKDWDDNSFDRHDYLSDTVAMTLSDGTTLKGKQSCVESAKKYRGTFSKVTSSISAWLPLTSNDRKDDIVCIWGVEADTFPDGKVEKRNLHEVWFFNKAGKITAMYQWAAKNSE